MTGLPGCGRVGDPIPPGQSLLSAPARPTLKGRDGTLVLSWNTPVKKVSGELTDQVFGYQIERLELPPGEKACEKCPSSPPRFQATKNTFWSDAAVKPGYTYRYRVSAIDHREREGLPSPWTEATWAAPPTPPEVALGWSRNVVRVRIGKLPASPFTQLGFAVYDLNGRLLQNIPAAVSESLIAGFKDSAPIRLVLRWEEETGEGWVLESMPLNLTVTPKDVEAPDPPSAIAAFSEVEGIMLHWIRAPGEDAASFLIERAQEGAPFAELARPDGAAFQYLDKNVEVGTSYQYRVSSIDRAGNASFPSSVARVRALGRK